MLGERARGPGACPCQQAFLEVKRYPDTSFFGGGGVLGCYIRKKCQNFWYLKMVYIY